MWVNVFIKSSCNDNKKKYYNFINVIRLLK